MAMTSMVLFFPALIIRLVTYPFDRRLRLLHLYACAWASLYTVTMPVWWLNIRGKERVRKDATYVVVSNHQSQLDILAAFRLFFHYKWVSKAEIFRVPFIGWNMVLNRYVKLKRGDKESIQQMMNDCETHLAEGSSIFIFPEGTRSFDGKVKSFKAGAFILAHKMKLPILPVAISGTNAALPKYSMKFQGIQRIYLRILDEIPYEKFKDMTPEETAEMVRAVINTEVERLDVFRTAH